MKIKLKLCCPGMAVRMEPFEMDVQEGTIVEDVLKTCLDIPGMTKEIFEGSYLINGEPATISSVLTDNAELIVIKVLDGG